MQRVEKLRSGPWDSDVANYPYFGEENSKKYTWIDPYSQYKCEVKRGPTYSWNGYVQLPQNHPDCLLKYGDWEEHIYVHGGITFESKGCFGFDCAHAGDILPELKLFQAFEDKGLAPRWFHRDETYKDYHYVKVCVTYLAKQFFDRMQLYKKSIEFK